ncbi:flagellar brake protein [Propionivibrio dicarboxylicus]|uniref:Flagellar brake protein YcgR n=1 Tax=Propionivibrio dicarboxylicus TaxID=83767 RepID=A0A1G8HC67_9RHOO|nr:flagellar brake protein [Propionivibrio dicarboxylicus]SDI04212.1 c-di-GMP-binding flagellar brake protein YcgR, contains PilZNR and PilZ domains [Propionivibrio dicarboxylicus]
MADPEVLPEPDNAPPRIELEQTDIYSRYLLYSRSEILAVLRTLIQKAALITVHFDHGKSFLLTTMLALTDSDTGFILDVGASREMNQRAALADKLILTAVVDKVKVQFSADGLTPIEYEGRPAFQGKLPDAVLRLQRREFFRLSTPIATPVIMSAIIQSPEGSPLSVDIPLFDISGGGVGLMTDPEIAASFERGDPLADCRIQLPDEGLLVANMIVRNKFDVTTRSGGQFVRVGCEFTDTPQSRLNMVQRYITRIERERKARLSGLGKM